MDAGHLLEWQSLKWRGQGDDNTEKTGIKKKTWLGHILQMDDRLPKQVMYRLILIL